VKICFLCYRGNMYCGGQGIYLYYLTQELHRLGHEVHVMAGPPYPQIPEGVNLYKLDGLNLLETGFEKALRAENFPHLLTPINLYEFVGTRLGMFPEMLTFSIRAYLKIRELLPHCRFDVIHDNQTLAYGMLLMKTLGIPVVATIHHPLCLDRKEDLAQARSILEKLRRIIFYPFFMQDLVSRRMDRVITDSLSSQADIKSIFKVPEDKLRLIYVGVDIDAFKKDDSLPKQPNSLIMVGNTEDRKKGVLYLLQAVRLLKEDIPIKLTIVDNPDPYDGFAPSRVREYGLQDVVSFTGRLSTPELVRHYCQAEIGVTASTVEGFGLPAAEAMACSVPVVATTAGALPEVVEDAVSGILVPPANPHALAGAIKLLLSDEALRKKMGDAGRKRVERHFSWRETAERTLEVYREVQNNNKLRAVLRT